MPAGETQYHLQRSALDRCTRCEGARQRLITESGFRKGGQLDNVGVAIRQERLRRAVLAPAGRRRQVEELTGVRNRHLRA